MGFIGPRLLFLGCVVPLWALPAQSQHHLRGVVTSTDTIPLRGAQVVVRNTQWQAESDATGHFELVLPNGDWELLFKRIGYAFQSVRLHLTDSGDAVAMVVAL